MICIFHKFSNDVDDDDDGDDDGMMVWSHTLTTTSLGQLLCQGQVVMLHSKLVLSSKIVLLHKT